MRELQAKTLLLINGMAVDLRYCEMIAHKLDKHYPSINMLLRGMVLNGWIRLTPYKHRKIVSYIDSAALEEARTLMATQDKK